MSAIEHFFAVHHYALLMAVLFVLNAVLAERTKEVAWIEKHPRLHAVYMGLAAFGIDPWKLGAALVQVVKGKMK